MADKGKKVVDIGQLVDAFQSQEGAIHSLSGGIGQGKTYEATRMVVERLLAGDVVYANWKLNLQNVISDQRKSLSHLFWNLIFFRKRFYDIDISKNLHLYDLDEDNIVDFLANLTDCWVFADEGQDVFDSYEGTKMSKKKRKSLTRTRHLNKTLVIISQRPQAIAVTARANVNIFYKMKKIKAPFLKPYFKVLATEDIDSNNMPDFESSSVWTDRGGFAKQYVFDAYDSWYLRKGMQSNHQLYFSAYDLSFKERIEQFCIVLFSRFFAFLRRLLPLKRGQSSVRSTAKFFSENALLASSAGDVGGQSLIASIKKPERAQYGSGSGVINHVAYEDTTQEIPF